jgi:UDP:flavonoid glycosyltransferase YjiC (YdhE family)
VRTTRGPAIGSLRMRVLIASTAGAGHVGPLLPVAAALRARGDELLLAGPPALAAVAQAAGLPFHAGAAPDERAAAEIWRRVPSATPAEAAVLVNRELFGRLCTAAMLPALERACERWRPDLVLRDPCEFASAIVAERAGIPHAQVAISLAVVEDASLTLAAPALEPYGAGLVAALRAAPYLSRFPSSLDPSPFAQTVRVREHVGRPPRPLPDWWEERDAPLLYATLGTVAGTLPDAVATFRTLLDAVAGLPARVLLTVGRDVDPRALGALPRTVHVERWVDQRDALAHAALVLCHGGSGTTFGALAAGLPLVVLPRLADQPANGRLVEACGAGVVVTAGDGAGRGAFPASSAIRAAIERVLAGPGHRAAAARIAAEMSASPTAGDALARLSRAA